MELVLEKKALKITIYGKPYAVSKPTVKQIQMFSKDIDAMSDVQKFERSKALVTELGIPNDVLDSLEIEHFEAIMSALTNHGKKN